MKPGNNLKCKPLNRSVYGGNYIYFSKKEYPINDCGLKPIQNELTMKSENKGEDC